MNPAELLIREAGREKIKTGLPLLQTEKFLLDSDEFLRKERQRLLNLSQRMILRDEDYHYMHNLDRFFTGTYPVLPRKGYDDHV